MAEMMAVKNCLAWIADEQVSDIVRWGPLVGTFREHSLITIRYSCEGHIESTKVLTRWLYLLDMLVMYTCTRVILSNRPTMQCNELYSYCNTQLIRQPHV